MKVERFSFPGIYIVLTIIGVGFFLFSTYKVSYEKRPSEHSGSPLGLHGDTIIALRIPQQTEFEHIAIQANGRASRSLVPFNNAVDTQTVMTLTPTEQADLEAFRTQWCQGQIKFRPIDTNEASYDLRVRCEVTGGEQTKVPVDLLPTVLKTILARLPPLQARR